MKTTTFDRIMFYIITAIPVLFCLLISGLGVSSTIEAIQEGASLTRIAAGVSYFGLGVMLLETMRTALKG